MKSINEFDSLFIHRQPVDLRKNINGLSAIVEAEMCLKLQSSSLFIFCNKRRSHMKILYFDHSGFALWLKRLEDSKFPWPKKIEEDVIKIEKKDMALLLQGINIWTRFEKIHFDRIT